LQQASLIVAMQSLLRCDISASQLPEIIKGTRNSHLAAEWYLFLIRFDTMKDRSSCDVACAMIVNTNYLPSSATSTKRKVRNPTQNYTSSRRKHLCCQFCCFCIVTDQ